MEEEQRFVGYTVKDTRSDQFGIRRIYHLPRAHIEMFFIEMHMLGVTSDLPVAQVGPLPPEVGQAKNPSRAVSPPKC